MFTRQQNSELPAIAYTPEDLEREARSACRVWGLRYAGWAVRVDSLGASLLSTGTNTTGEAITLYYAL